MNTTENDAPYTEPPALSRDLSGELEAIPANRVNTAEKDALRNALGTDQDDVFGDLALTIARAVEGQVASAVNGFGADLVRVERCYSHGIARAALTALRAHVIPPAKTEDQT